MFISPKVYLPRSHKHNLSTVKKLDGILMPPCYKVLQKKLRRTHLITRRWLASIQPNPPNVIHEGESTPRILDVLFEDVHENDSMTSSFGNNGEKQSFTSKYISNLF